MLKYFGEQSNDHHGGQLFWPGTAEGYPVRNNGGTPHIKQDEMDNLELSFDFKRRVFKLWEEQDLEDYRLVMDRVTNKWYGKIHLARHWDEEHNDEVVVLEWVQVYGEVPRNKRASSGASNAPVGGTSYTLRPGESWPADDGGR
jgi:hypothetical protein